jgi:hypothetical protein
LGLSVSSQNIVLDWIRGRVNAAPTTLWLGLHSQYPATPGNECSVDYGGRIALVGSQLSDPFAGSAGIQEVTNRVELLSAPCTAPTFVAAFTLWDAEFGGTTLLSGTAGSVGPPVVGDVLVIPANGLTLRVTPGQLMALAQECGGLATLPIASTTVLGAVKIGSGVLIAPDGTISVDLLGAGVTNLSYNPATRQVISSSGTDATLTLADGTNAGLFASVDWLKLNGIEAGATAYVLPTADGSRLGGVKIGSRLSVLGDGTISADVQPGRDTNLGYTPSTREVTSSTGTPVVLPLFSSGVAGMVPQSGGGTINYLRADLTWGAPPGRDTNLGYSPSTREVTSSTGTPIALPLATPGAAGLVPQSGGGTTNYLRADLTWAAPPGGGGGNTNLSLANNTANTLDVASDTGSDVTLPAATGSLAGLFTAAGFTKLSGIATGATANSNDATLLARANHTGTQTASTISDFISAVRAQILASLVAGANITLTPAGSGATQTISIAATGGGGGGGGTRNTASALINLNSGASGTVTIVLAKSCLVYSIQSDKAARVVLYSSAAMAAADATRLLDVPAVAGFGVVGEVILAAPGVQQLDPVDIAINRETVPSSTYTIRVTNNGASGDVNVTIAFLTLES